jgi:predicted phosphodiesterase
MKYRILPAKPKLFADLLVLKEDPILIIADSHSPYQNAELLHKAFAIAKKRKIKTLIHAGDLIDAAEYNSQAKNEAKYSIQEEIAAARSIVDTAAQFFDTMYFIPGNHDEYYLKKEKISFSEFVKDRVAQGLYSAQIITTEYDYLFYDSFAVIGHPSGYSMIAGELAAQLADKYEKNVLIAHDHLQGYKKSEKGYYGVSIGGSFEHNRFWYKEKAFNLFPPSKAGFVIIKDREIWLYNDKAKGTKIVRN